MAAPVWLPADYSVWTHSISESAAQGVPHAVWARCGLALMGLGAALTTLPRPRKPVALAICLLLFALAMGASAAWSHRPWSPSAVFDARADRWHSLAAQTAGVAFVLAVALRIAQHWAMQCAVDALDASAGLAALLAPLVMLLGWPGPGAAQRVMFALAYLWLAREATRAPGTTMTAAAANLPRRPAP